MPRKSSAANAPKRSDGNVRRVIGANIKARRLALDWNQQELADRFGVSRSAISQYEIGTGEVNAGDLPRLAQILSVTLLDFYRTPTRDHRAAKDQENASALDQENAVTVEPENTVTFQELWERGLLNGDNTSGLDRAGGKDAAGIGAGDRSRPFPEPITFVPTKKGENVPTEGSDEAKLVSLFHDMTPLERATVLRIARALQGTLGQ